MDRRSLAWFWVALAWLVTTASVPNSAQAQPPGTPPPEAWMDGSLETIQPEAFLFLDESRTPVVMPRMTFEEMDRLRRMQASVETTQTPVVMQRMLINGKVIDQRAELSVELRFTVQRPVNGSATDGLISVDLAMDGFHLLDTPTVEGCPNAVVQLSSKGYQCVLPANCFDDVASITCRVRLQASTRVNLKGTDTLSMPLSLPVAPTELTIDLGAGQSSDRKFNVSAVDVVGSGREVLRRMDNTASNQTYQVLGDGGSFALQWQRLPIQTDAGVLLDVSSVSDIVWTDPTESPVLDTRLQIENLRGPLSSAKIELPIGAILLRTPLATDRTLSGSSSVTESTNWTVSSGSASNQIQIQRNDSPSAASSTNSVDLRLRMQLPVPEASSDAPWRVQLPKVDQCIAQHGEVQVRTAEDHRLRWRPHPGVDAISSSSTALTSNGLSGESTTTTIDPDDASTESTSVATGGERTYLFRFARTEFDLPVWLSTKQSQTRVRVRAALSLVRQNATVTLVLKGQDSGIDPKDLRLELGDWQLRSIVTSSEETELEVMQTDPKIVQWQVEATDGRWPSGYTIVAERSWSEPLDDDPKSDGESMTVSLPKLVSVDPATLVEEVVLDVQKTGLEAFVVDLPQSPGVQRLSSSGGTSLPSDGHTFRLLNPESDWSVRGSMLRLPLEISLAGQTVTDGRDGRWVWRNDWNLTSETDLGGTLTFEMPIVSGANNSFSAFERIDWTVRVNGFVGAVQSVENDLSASNHRWQIVSPQLSIGTHRMELHGQIVPDSSTADTSPLEEQSDGTSEDSDFSRVDGWLALPRVVADRIDTSSGYQWLLYSKTVDTQGRIWDWELADESLLDGVSLALRSTSSNSSANAGSRSWKLTSIPSSAIPMSRFLASTDDPLLNIPRAVMRSLVSDRSRHEQLLAAVAGGQSIQVGLVPGLEKVGIEATYDGRPIAYLRQSNGFQIDLPAAMINEEAALIAQGTENTIDEPRERLLDVRLWTEVSSNAWWSEIRPLMQLPVRSGWVYWDLTVASDSHLCWAAPSIGRAMKWQPDRFRLVRRAALREEDLQRWVAQDIAWRSEAVSANPAFGVIGNRYLFFAGDTLEFSAATVSRTSLWLFVGGLVVLLAGSLQLFPRLRHPTFLLIVSVFLAGLVFVLPDAVVLLAQLTTIALFLVAVLFAISALVSPLEGDRVLRPISSPSPGGSTRIRRSRALEVEKDDPSLSIESTMSGRVVEQHEDADTASSRLLIAPATSIDSESGTSGAAR